MKLRTQLFVSFAGLLSLAIVGLMLGIVSVRQVISAQSVLQEQHIKVIQHSQRLHQTLSEQLYFLYTRHDSLEAWHASDELFAVKMAEARAAVPKTTQPFLDEVDRLYRSYAEQVEYAIEQGEYIVRQHEIAMRSLETRDLLARLKSESIAAINQAGVLNKERANLIMTLLWLISLAVLGLGGITAYSLARRFGQPIEALAAASDQIGRGNFNVTLPLSPIAELTSLSKRFGLMAESLRQFKSTDVEALAAGQRRLQAVLDSIDDGLLILDRQGCLERINPVAQSQLGWGEQQLGKTLGETLGKPEIDQQIRLVLHGGALAERPADLKVGNSDEMRLLAYSLTPILHDQGHIAGAVMVLRDVTEQRAFERLRSEFLLRASHELRTPVTGMHMAFSLLGERLRFSEESREQDLFNTVEEEMQRLVQLINDLLNFSRYQNGMQQLTLEYCNIAELLEQAHKRIAPQADKQGVQVSCEIDSSLPYVQLDPAQISRVLDNLLDNALRHSSTGGHIRLLARLQLDRVLISVEDTGEGIAFGQQLRIFEPFVQIGRKKGGVGLGLALCKEIVQLHRGRIGVYSRPEQGTQFYFSLPC